mmetsp:Transcript_11652/g.47085  ORF Transcript_11652/g.47085 Transcript_11652/m.47085 type:complete len:299 (+) Transcript_11652:201-1097(+)
MAGQRQSRPAAGCSSVRKRRHPPSVPRADVQDPRPGDHAQRLCDVGEVLPLREPEEQPHARSRVGQKGLPRELLPVQRRAGGYGAALAHRPRSGGQRDRAQGHSLHEHHAPVRATGEHAPTLHQPARSLHQSVHDSSCLRRGGEVRAPAAPLHLPPPLSGGQLRSEDQGLQDGARAVPAAGAASDPLLRLRGYGVSQRHDHYAEAAHLGEVLQACAQVTRIAWPDRDRGQQPNAEGPEDRRQPAAAAVHPHPRWRAPRQGRQVRGPPRRVLPSRAADRDPPNAAAGSWAGSFRALPLA